MNNNEKYLRSIAESLNNEKYLRSIAESLKSIDRSLKKISGKNSVKTIEEGLETTENDDVSHESVKKTYAEMYFAKDEDGKWSEK